MSRILIYTLGVLLLIALVALGVKSLELSYARRDIGALKNIVGAYKLAAKDNLDTIARLELANRQCAAKNAANERLARSFFNAERDYAAQLQVAKSKTERTIQVIYEHDPSARQWGVVAVPPGIVERLRAGSHRPNAGH